MKSIAIVRMTEGDMLEDVAELHLDAFSGYVNTLLGRGYIKAFAKWFVKSQGAIAIVAIDANKKVVGYALGAPTGYSARLNRDLFWGTAARILVRPWVILNPQFRNVLGVRMKSLIGIKPMATQTMESPSPSMSLVAIGVASAHRRSKIGQHLMQVVEDEARSLQMRSLVLSVYASATAARRFYEKCGWQLCSEVEMRGNVLKYRRMLGRVIN